MVKCYFLLYNFALSLSQKIGIGIVKRIVHIIRVFKEFNLLSENMYFKFHIQAWK